MTTTRTDSLPETPLVRAIPYYPALDGLRALAVVLVLFVHAHGLLGLPGELLDSAAWHWTHNGWMGVDLFFVTSGFLITSILISISNRKQSLKIFWLRRGLRIFPLYYLYLFILIALSISPISSGSPGLPQSPFYWIPFFIYLGNFNVIFPPASPLETSILWTLSVEEQFYAIWPVLFAKMKRKELFRLSILLIPLAAVFRAMVFWAAPNTDAFYFLSFCRMDAIFAGATLAFLWSQPEKRETISKWSGLLLIPALLCLLTVLLTPPYRIAEASPQWITFSYGCTAIAWAIIVAWALRPPAWITPVLCNSVIRYIGKICYGIYIWQALTGRLVKHWLYRFTPDLLSYELYMALFILATIAVASLSWHLIESPLLRFKDLLPYIRS